MNQGSIHAPFHCQGEDLADKCRHTTQGAVYGQVWDSPLPTPSGPPFTFSGSLGNPKYGGKCAHQAVEWCEGTWLLMKSQSVAVVEVSYKQKFSLKSTSLNVNSKIP